MKIRTILGSLLLFASCEVLRAQSHPASAFGCADPPAGPGRIERPSGSARHREHPGRARRLPPAPPALRRESRARADPERVARTTRRVGDLVWACGRARKRARCFLGERGSPGRKHRDAADERWAGRLLRDSVPGGRHVLRGIDPSKLPVGGESRKEDRRRSLETASNGDLHDRIRATRSTPSSCSQRRRARDAGGPKTGCANRSVCTSQRTTSPTRSVSSHHSSARGHEGNDRITETGSPEMPPARAFEVPKGKFGDVLKVREGAMSGPTSWASSSSTRRKEKDKNKLRNGVCHGKGIQRLSEGRPSLLFRVGSQVHRGGGA